MYTIQIGSDERRHSVSLRWAIPEPERRVQDRFWYASLMLCFASGGVLILTPHTAWYVALSVLLVVMAASLMALAIRRFNATKQVLVTTHELVIPGDNTTIVIPKGTQITGTDGVTCMQYGHEPEQERKRR